MRFPMRADDVWENYQPNWITEHIDDTNRTAKWLANDPDNLHTWLEDWENPGAEAFRNRVATFPYFVHDLVVMNKVPSEVTFDQNQPHVLLQIGYNFVSKEQLDGYYSPRNHQIQAGAKHQFSCTAVGCCFSNFYTKPDMSEEEKSRIHQNTQNGRCCICGGGHRELICPVFTWPHQREVMFLENRACFRCSRILPLREAHRCSAPNITCRFCQGHHSEAVCQSDNAWTFSFYVTCMWRSRAIIPSRNHFDEMARRIESWNKPTFKDGLQRIRAKGYNYERHPPTHIPFLPETPIALIKNLIEKEVGRIQPGKKIVADLGTYDSMVHNRGPKLYQVSI